MEEERKDRAPLAPNPPSHTLPNYHHSIENVKFYRFRGVEAVRNERKRDARDENRWAVWDGELSAEQRAALVVGKKGFLALPDLFYLPHSASPQNHLFLLRFFLAD